MERKQSKFNEIVSQGLKDAKFSERTFRDFFEKEDKVEFGQFIKAYTTSVFKQAGVHICDCNCEAEKGNTEVSGKTADAKTFMKNINKFLSDDEDEEASELEVEIVGDLFEFIGQELKKLNKPTKEGKDA